MDIQDILFLDDEPEVVEPPRSGIFCGAFWRSLKTCCNLPRLDTVEKKAEVVRKSLKEIKQRESRYKSEMKESNRKEAKTVNQEVQCKIACKCSNSGNSMKYELKVLQNNEDEKDKLFKRSNYKSWSEQFKIQEISTEKQNTLKKNDVTIDKMVEDPVSFKVAINISPRVRFDQLRNVPAPLYDKLTTTSNSLIVKADTHKKPSILKINYYIADQIMQPYKRLSVEIRDVDYNAYIDNNSNGVFNTYCPEYVNYSPRPRAISPVFEDERYTCIPAPKRRRRLLPRVPFQTTFCDSEDSDGEYV